MTSKVSSSDPTPVDFSDHCKTGYKYFKKGLAFTVNQTGDGGTVNAVAKLARRVFEFLAAFAPVAALFGPAGAFFKGISELFKVLSIFKSGQELLNCQQIRKLATSLLGITVGSLAIVKLFDSFGWIPLAKISASFGKVAVIGSIAVVPLSVFVAWLEGIKATIEISISISSLLKIARKVSDVNKKRRFWATEINNDKCQQKIHKYRIESKDLASNLDALQKKQKNLQVKVEKWSKRQRKLDKRKRRLQTQNKTKQCFAKTIVFVQKIRPPKTSRKLKKWTKLSEQVAKEIGTTEAATRKTLEKKICWKRMSKRYDHHIPIRNQVRFEEDRVAIEAMRVKKFQQLNIKKSNLRLEQFKEIVGIITNIGLIAITVITTTFFFIGLFSTPIGGTAISFILPSLGLVLATVGLGMHFFKRYKGKKTKKPGLPELSSAKDWRKNKSSKKKQSAKTQKTENTEDISDAEKKSNKLNKKKHKQNSRHLEPAEPTESAA